MHVSKTLFFLIHTLLFSMKTFASTPSQNADAILKPIVISDPSYRQLNMAIPIINGDTQDQKYRKRLYSLTKFTGLFYVMKEKAYEGFSLPVTTLPMTQRAEFFKPWKTIGVETILKIKLIFEKTGELRVQAKAMDTVSMDDILYKEYRLVSPSSFNEAAKKILDEIQTFYTGRRGVFSTKIAFIGKKTKHSKKQVYICDINGDNVKQVTFGDHIHISPSWSPDGNTIIFTSYEKGNPDLYSTNLQSFKTERLSSYHGLNSGGVYDPSGKRIVYTGSGKNSANLFSIDPITKKRIPLTFSKALHVDPDFSPDGKSLVYVSSEYGNPHVVKADVLNIQTKKGPQLTLTQSKRLTHIGWYNTMPRWSPNSKEIVYASYDRVRFDLYVMDPNGNNKTRLTLNSGNNEAPTWSPNGRLIMFHSDRDSNDKSKQLYLMNKDGTGQRKIETGLYHAETPRWSL